MSSGTGSRYGLPSEPPRGLTGAVGQERIVLPLKAVDVWFVVFVDLAEVQMDQVFHQTASSALDVVYSFPLQGGLITQRRPWDSYGRIRTGCAATAADDTA